MHAKGRCKRTVTSTYDEFLSLNAFKSSEPNIKLTAGKSLLRMDIIEVDSETFETELQNLKWSTYIESEWDVFTSTFSLSAIQRCSGIYGSSDVNCYVTSCKKKRTLLGCKSVGFPKNVSHRWWKQCKKCFSWMKTSHWISFIYPILFSPYSTAFLLLSLFIRNSLVQWQFIIRLHFMYLLYEA